ncbi:MAG: 4Fe-4S ferredoxin, iron-sulpur binding protein [Firmicutes bacterium]|nr:4Fe-4S ferredoxin, iron-sulpur binding protein [Bacillota bacterium]
MPEEFYPHRVWPLAKTVIVLGVPVWLPIVEAAPAQLGREQYTITNELLDEAAYRLAAYLNRNGHAAINICRDGYGDSDVLMETPVAVFSHVWAAHYAGLGKVGWNHTLLTPQFGPRLRLVSILTALELPGDPMLEKDLCTHCMLCQKICPANALAGERTDLYADMDKRACTGNGKRLRKAYRNPCGFCIKVCPVGKDRQLFQSTNVQKYFKEQEVLAQNPDAPEYRSWQHLRKYGGYALEEEIQAAQRIGK